MKKTYTDSELINRAINIYKSNDKKGLCKLLKDYPPSKRSKIKKIMKPFADLIGIINGDLSINKAYDDLLEAENEIKNLKEIHRKSNRCIIGNSIDIGISLNYRGIVNSEDFISFFSKLIIELYEIGLVTDPILNLFFQGIYTRYGKKMKLESKCEDIHIPKYILMDISKSTLINMEQDIENTLTKPILIEELN